MPSLRVVPNPPPRLSLAEWLPRTWRAYPRAELEALFSHRQLVVAIESGVAKRVAPGLYASAAQSESTVTRVDAAVQWAGPEARIGGEASLFLAGALHEPPMRVEVVVPAERRMSGRPPWARVRRLSYRPQSALVDGWHAVDPAVAWCHAYSEMARDARASALCALVAADPVALELVTRSARELPALRARRRMLALIATVAAGSESFLEVHAVEQVFVGRRFRGLLRQHVVRTAGGRYRLDLYDAPSMTAIELDGVNYHVGVKEWQRDLRRDADLAALGILTLRFSYRDLMERPHWCAAAALDVLRSRMPPAHRDAPGVGPGRGTVQIEPLDAVEGP